MIPEVDLHSQSTDLIIQVWADEEKLILAGPLMSTW